MNDITIDPAVAALIVTSAALLFAAGAIHKFRDLRRFDEMFAAYRLLPPAMRPVFSKLVPLAEAVVAGGLIVEAVRVPALVLGILLLLVYAAAIGINLLRGRTELACGCGGPDDRRPIAAWMIWRNVMIAVLLGAVMLPWSPRPLAATDLVTIGFGTATCALVYLCFDRLLGRAGRALTAGT